MSSTVKTSSTLDITLLNSEMSESVFKINNPNNNEFTLADIRAAYSVMLGQEEGQESLPSSAANSHLFDKSGKAYIFVSSAKKTVTTTTSADIT